MKPLRRWVKKRQFNSPEWDLPMANASVGAGPSMHQPYYPQQVRQLLSQDDSSPPAGSSPVHNNLQASWQLVHTPQPSDQLVQVLRNAGTGTPSQPLKAVLGSTPPASALSSIQGSLTALFGAAGSADKRQVANSFCFDRLAIMSALMQ